MCIFFVPVLFLNSLINSFYIKVSYVLVKKHCLGKLYSSVHMSDILSIITTTKNEAMSLQDEHFTTGLATSGLLVGSGPSSTLVLQKSEQQQSN